MWRACRPISSSASRKAVAIASASSGSARPPGKLIWPGWSVRWSVRWVSSTVTWSRCTRGTSTEACVGSRSVNRRSTAISGVQVGGAVKRRRSASGLNCSRVTGGRWSSMDRTGSSSGLKLNGMTDSGTKKAAWRRRPLLAAQCRSGELFLDPSRLARTLAQVVQLGAADVAAALDFDRREQRAVHLEGALHAFAAADLAHDEAGVQPAVALGDHHAFIGLHAL